MTESLNTHMHIIHLYAFFPEMFNCSNLFPITFWGCLVSYWYLIGDFPGGLDGKVSVYNAGDLGWSPGSGRSPGEGNGNPLQYWKYWKYHFQPGKSHGQRSLVGYSLWGRKESDTTEQLHFHFQGNAQKSFKLGFNSM